MPASSGLDATSLFLLLSEGVCDQRYVGTSGRDSGGSAKESTASGDGFVLKTDLGHSRNAVSAAIGAADFALVADPRQRFAAFSHAYGTGLADPTHLVFPPELMHS
ncbi:hypothetical protein ASC97_31610 [Rhizobium sp. Root1203]|uniref:hypothetical protein n=1 Tax=Rhizobium sp. Root1203 TaxID=1736427 RepID=UPI00070DA003|nr:hypothetical protein [Rhizobium sp. Root1203]KQV14718.1 hypothetical protein ASC97_31610 [Rhizobium sp. Root1203]